MRASALISMVVILLIGCTTAGGEITLTAPDHGKTITASPNQIVAITLDSNPSTGYKWNMTGEPDAKVLSFQSSAYNPGGSMPGAGGSETWKFRVVGAGSTSLKLGYFRPFDPAKISSEFAITVIAK